MPCFEFVDLIFKLQQILDLGFETSQMLYIFFSIYGDFCWVPNASVSFDGSYFRIDPLQTDKFVN